MARDVAGRWQGGAGTALSAFSTTGLVHRRKDLLFEVEAEMIGARRAGRLEQLPELQELRRFVGGVLVCVLCGSEIDPAQLAEFAEYETDDGVLGRAHTGCVSTAHEQRTAQRA
jgi:hypothetical protein